MDGKRIMTDSAAMDLELERFILISTDKAVRPTNIMGASKRLAELFVQDMAQRSDKTLFSIVRFGAWTVGCMGLKEAPCRPW